MKTFLLFVGAIAGIVLLGWIVHKITGSRAWMLDEWPFDPGETVVWRDDATDFAVIPKLGQAASMKPVPVHRQAVVVTNERILLATKALGGRQLVQYVLYPGSAPTDAAKKDAGKLDGGLLTTGYSTMVIRPGGMKTHLDEKPPYVAIDPADTTSSANVAEIRIYTDKLDSFRLP